VECRAGKGQHVARDELGNWAGVLVLLDDDELAAVPVGSGVFDTCGCVSAEQREESNLGRVCLQTRTFLYVSVNSALLQSIRYKRDRKSGYTTIAQSDA
jgi:hypothetical protein